MQQAKQSKIQIKLFSIVLNNGVIKNYESQRNAEKNKFD